jgi:hypothetical protein
MFVSKLSRRSAWLFLLFTSAAALAAQPEQKPGFEPYSGQPGKDVVWVPTPQALVDKMLDLAKVTSSDVLMDLGSGDGRTVITAAKRGATATGIEYNPDMVELSKANAEKAGVTAKAHFMKADLFETDLSKATVITMFLLPDINLKLRPKILDLKPGTRVVSNTFTMGDWVADETASVDAKEGCSYWCRALLWIVPAKVEGTWKTPQGDLALTQKYQEITGTLKNGSKSINISNAKMHGDQIVFTADGSVYTGKVVGNTIEGTYKGSSSGNWSASRGAAAASAN